MQRAMGASASTGTWDRRKLTTRSLRDTIKMPLTKKKWKKIQNYLALSEKHPEAWLAHGFRQHDQQNELVSYCCLLQEVTLEELIQRGLQHSHHLPDPTPVDSARAAVCHGLILQEEFGAVPSSGPFLSRAEGKDLTTVRWKWGSFDKVSGGAFSGWVFLVNAVSVFKN